MAPAEKMVISVSKVLSDAFLCHLFYICFCSLPYYSLKPMLSPDGKCHETISDTVHARSL